MRISDWSSDVCSSDLAGEADHVRRQRAVRIEALLLALEVEAGNAEGVDGVLLARRQVALQPDEAAPAGELGAQLGGAELRQHFGELLGGRSGVAHVLRIGV